MKKKICSKCKANLPVKMFHKMTSSPAGIRPACKNCHNALCREYTTTHLAKRVATNRRWRETYPERHRAWLRKNRLKLNADNNAWWAAHPVERSIKYQRHRTARTAEDSFTISQWRSLCTAANHRCLACGKKRKLTIDHIVPIIEGGSNRIENIQPLCKPCNSSKGSKTIDYRGTLEACHASA